jgi:endoglucanase
VPRGEKYTIHVIGPIPANSPHFAVEPPDVLYPGLLLNTLFFYETERDGPDYIPNALRTAPGHLKDRDAKRFVAPPLDDNGYVNNKPPTPPLVLAYLPNIDASGGWWDAGDYEKYVVTASYVVAMMETGIRDFPEQMGANAPWHPPAPLNSVSYSGNSGPGAPARSDFSGEARFGLEWLMKMWDRRTKTLSFQVDNSQDWNYYGYGIPTSAGGDCGGTYDSPYCLITEYDIWTLPQAGDLFKQPGDPEPCDPLTTFYICNRPVFLAAPSGSLIVPNIDGRLTAAFALCYQLHRLSDPRLADHCLRLAEEIYSLADLTSHPDPAPSSGPGVLVTAVPSYPEQSWDDDMEWGATELSLALRSAGSARNLPDGLPVTDPDIYLRQATKFAKNYIDKIYTPGYEDTLNLYDVSGLAHFDLYHAIELAHDPSGLALSGPAVREQLLDQVGVAIGIAETTAFDFGNDWDNGDITSHGAGVSVMASEAYALTHEDKYKMYAQRWLGNILGANAWGSSFIVGDGSTFPNCIQHQVANLAGALNGSSGGTPVLWGAATEGPNTSPSSGLVPGLILCPANGVDTFAQFNGNTGAFDPNDYVLYQDNMQSYTTTEPAVDLTATSFLMWSWRLVESDR